LRSHTLSQREIELDTLVRARERTLKELEDHLRAALSMLSKRDATVAALESRVATAQQETQDYRQRLAKVVQRAFARHQRAATQHVSRPKPIAPPTRSKSKKPKRKRVVKRR
jgi:chromosome segregation ATPase